MRTKQSIFMHIISCPITISTQFNLNEFSDYRYFKLHGWQGIPNSWSIKIEGNSLSINVRSDHDISFSLISSIFSNVYFKNATCKLDKRFHWSRYN